MGTRISLAFLGIAVGLAIVGIWLAFSHGKPHVGTSLAGGTDGAMAVDCNTSQGGVQSACQYNPGANFQVQIHAAQAPPEGYSAFQAKFAWDSGVVNYSGAPDPADEALWPDCTIAARSPDPPTGDPPQLFGCFPFPFPTSPFFKTGAVLEFTFQCKPFPDSLSPAPGLDPNQSLIHLIPRAGDPQAGTHFTDINLAQLDPALSDAVITCGEGVTPTPTATPVLGAVTFVGTLAEATTPAACGPGTIILTVSGDHTQVLSVEVRDFPVAGSDQNLTVVFDPPVDIVDGSFSDSGPLPDPFSTVTATIGGTFDFAADPPAVDGTLNAAAGAAVLCDTTFSAVGAPPPTPLPTATAVPPTVAATALPAVGSSPLPDSGGDGTFWAIIAGVAGAVALATAGLAVLRRRTA